MPSIFLYRKVLGVFLLSLGLVSTFKGTFVLTETTKRGIIHTPRILTDLYGHN